MSQAEELLNNLSVHEHDMSDSDAYFIIDPKSRQIDHFSRTQNVIMQGDHKSELYTFQLPRYVEGHDMLLCNRVRVHYNNIDAETGEENADVYEMTDLRINPDDPETVISSWEIHKQATQLVGILSFLVQYECVDSNGESTYEWHTDFYDDVIVKKTKHNGEASVVEYSDILEQWYTRLFGAGDSVIAAVEDAGQAQVDIIRRKGEATLATIPEDYTSTYNMAEEALRRKANAIVVEADGTTISVDNASDNYLFGLNIYGKSVQDGEPTPAAPIEIVSVEKPTVTVCGKNLCPSQTYGTIFPCQLEKDTIYTVSVDNNTDDAMCLLVYDENQVRFQSVKCTNDIGERRYATLKPEQDVYFAMWAWANTTTVENGQIEIGSEATEYESYIGQAIVVSHTLCGIPVSEGGNYIDPNGQQWICDEVDFERGVIVQRVGQIILNNDRIYYYNTDTKGKEFFYTAENNNVLSWETRMYSSHFPVIGIGIGMDDDYWTQFSGSGGIRFRHKNLTSLTELSEWLRDNPIHVCYVLATPVETPLTDVELLEYKKLRTSYCNTTVVNDQNAHMVIDYVADTKLYIDERIVAALIAAGYLSK